MTAGPLRHTGHTILDNSLPPWRTGLPSWVNCECGVTVTAPTDGSLPDPHEPIKDAFAAHRLEAGAGRAGGIEFDREGYKFGNASIAGTRGAGKDAA